MSLEILQVVIDETLVHFNRIDRALSYRNRGFDRAGGPSPTPSPIYASVSEGGSRVPNHFFECAQRFTNVKRVTVTSLTIATSATPPCRPESLGGLSRLSGEYAEKDVMDRCQFG